MPQDQGLVAALTASKWYGLMVTGFYMCNSILMTLINKTVFTAYGFHAPLVLFISQMVTTLVMLVVFKHLGIITFADWKLTTAKSVFPIAFFFVLMVGSGLTALRYVNVPMYSALRKQTTFIVMVNEFLFLGMKPSMGVVLSIALMSVGAAVAGWNDSNASVIGYALVLFCCLATACYTVSIKKINEAADLSIFGLLFYNTVQSLPFVVIFAYLDGQFDYALSFPGWADVGFQCSFALSTVAAFSLNYSIYLSTLVNSPLVTSVTGDLKNVGTDLIAIISFNDVVLTPGYVAGVLISTAGGVCYSFVKLQAFREKERQAKFGQTDSIKSGVVDEEEAAALIDHSRQDNELEEYV